MRNEIKDGQNIVQPVLNVMSCFFCIEQKKNCRSISLNITKDSDPRLKKYEHHKFIICDECMDRSENETDYIPNAIASFVVAEEFGK